MATNACIVSLFMNNIHPDTVRYQRDVVAKFNKSGHTHFPTLTEAQPADSMDYVWALNGLPPTGFNMNVEHKLNFDVILFLDIDCIPLCEDAIDFFIDMAAEGKVVGNAQRSGHIENGQHVFAAPAAVAMSRDTYLKIGKPSALPTNRSDASEEYTWAAEQHGVPVDLCMPIKYDAPPIRMAWETNKEPYWRLADGMPNYGIGTTFGVGDKELFYHNFQIFHPGQQERFWEKCKSVLGE